MAWSPSGAFCAGSWSLTRGSSSGKRESTRSLKREPKSEIAPLASIRFRVRGHRESQKNVPRKRYRLPLASCAALRFPVLSSKLLPLWRLHFRFVINVGVTDTLHCKSWHDGLHMIVRFELLRQRTAVHKEQMPSWKPIRTRPPALSRARGVRVHGSVADALDRRAGGPGAGFRQEGSRDEGAGQCEGYELRRQTPAA